MRDRHGQVRWFWIVAGCAVLPMVLAAGCSESSAMRKARQTREQTLAGTLRRVGNLDEHRSDNLARTGNIIAERQRLDERLIRSDMDKVGEWLQAEFQDWARKEPAYRNAIKRELKGDPANIERTAPHFVY